ncbi:MAG: M15 family metallopeptidase [Clostridia bacterium]|nr:M15 family metallopeptidase [Clostridia bacterium]
MNQKRKRRKKKNIRPILLLLIFCILFIGGLCLALQKPIPVYADSLNFFVGEDLHLSDIIVNVENGVLLDSRKVITSSEKGEMQIDFEMENLFHRKSEGSVIIKFIEETPLPETDEPEITKAPEVTKSNSISISSPEKIYVALGETPDFSLCSAKDENGETYPIVHSENYDTAKEGEYKVTLSATDKTGKKVTKEVLLLVTASPFGEKGKLIDGTYKTQNGKNIVIKNGIATIEGILIANKSYSLPKNYPANGVTSETQAAFDEMKLAAANEGHTLNIRSGYRSYERQEYLFNNYAKNDGLEDALTYSARPGHSEHQTGLGIDINTASTSESKLPTMKPSLDWLNENAYKYGFVLRYPDGKSGITGYIFEPWHYRYVGKDLAEKLYNGGDWITLEEHFGIDSIYRGY